jgi:hypothetical protein
MATPPEASRPDAAGGDPAAAAPEPATQAVWAGEDEARWHGATQVPICQSAAFAYPDLDAWLAVAQGRAAGRIHSRNTNPTVAAFEAKIQAPVTEHFCIQGWSGIAEWGGVPMRDLLARVRPLPAARYAVFYSFGPGTDGGEYYDAHGLRNMNRRLSLLALDMNGRPLSVIHGAPLRLRCENELGFKLVKWISAIELVADYRHLGAGRSGYPEDHEFFGYRAPI